MTLDQILSPILDTDTGHARYASDVSKGRTYAAQMLAMLSPDLAARVVAMAEQSKVTR